MEIRSRKIAKFSDFIDFVDSICEPKDKLVLFRGQRRQWSLLPRIARLNTDDPFLETERTMLDEFKRQAIPLLEHRPNTDWDWLALAQHHGMATRLLDWTRNPLAALWFTVCESPAKDHKGKEERGVVWAYEPKSQDVVDSPRARPFSVNQTKVFRPRHITRRITAQAGWFTVHKYMESRDGFIPLDRQPRFLRVWTRIIIPPESFSDFRYSLDTFGINKSSLFPDLEGLCEHLTWLCSYMEDEMSVVKGVAKKTRVIRRKRIAVKPRAE